MLIQDLLSQIITLLPLNPKGFLCFDTLPRSNSTLSLRFGFSERGLMIGTSRIGTGTSRIGIGTSSILSKIEDVFGEDDWARFISSEL